MYIQPSTLRFVARLFQQGRSTRKRGSILRRSSKRLPIIASLLLVALPLSIISLGASLLDRHRAAEQLEKAMEDVSENHSSGSGIYHAKTLAEQKLDEAQGVLEGIGRDKRIARMEVVALYEQKETLQEQYGIDISNSGALLAMVNDEAAQFRKFIRYVKARSTQWGILRRMLVVSLGEVTDLGIRNQAIQKARVRILRVVLHARKIEQDLPEKQKEYQVQIDRYSEAWERYLEAKKGVEDANARIAQVQRITEEVHAQVLRLQSQLARIDAQIQAKLERELIEKGLMDARPGERSDGRIRSTQRFSWPVRGRISAGGMNAAYKDFFGVAHRGLDIVVPQGTPVLAASDGVVFLAQKGGQFGYSYILIGHRDGYATLYGHLSGLNVGSGQEVEAGSVIGWSGGTPGTHGAGPMTTGAHVHFETIANGTHINPMSVLP